MALNANLKSIPNFFKEVKSEMSKVTWLTRQQTLRLTGIVIGVSVIVAAFISFLDYSFTKLMEIWL
jgi:preprotein translocase SecE subunit